MTLKLALGAGYWSSGAPAGMEEAIRTAEELGFNSMWTAEAYGSDALTPLAWWGASTKTVELRHVDHPDVGPHPNCCRNDHDDARPPEQRPRDPRHRRLRTAGRRRAGTASPPASARTHTVRGDHAVGVATRQHGVESRASSTRFRIRAARASARRSSRPCTRCAATSRSTYQARKARRERRPRCGDLRRLAPAALLAQPTAFYRQCLNEGSHGPQGQGRPWSSEDSRSRPVTGIIVNDDVEAAANMVRPMLAPSGRHGGEGPELPLRRVRAWATGASPTRCGALPRGREGRGDGSDPHVAVRAGGAARPKEKIPRGLSWPGGSCLTTLVVSGPPHTLRNIAEIVHG